MENELNIEMAQKVAQAVAIQNGTTYYVGGYVRDQLRGVSNKDIDIEIHGLTPDQVESILDSLGQRLVMGESFGIYNLKGYDLDISLPRKENDRGKGHEDLSACVDPFIGTYKAALRRDFTINAMMQDVLTGEVLDYFGGKQDLAKKVIRHVNDTTFVEDPLRVIRAAQFAARFGFTVSAETIGLCRQIDLSSLPNERVLGEVKKALLKSDRPSVFFETLRRMNQLDPWFTELKPMIGTPQNAKHHAEGDAWVHTMMVIDEAAKLKDHAQNPFGFMLAALTHDFGKPVVTEVVNGELHALRHEEEGLPIARAFIARLTNEEAVLEYALNLDALHMKPHILAADRSSKKATSKMFDEAIDPEGLIYLAIADGLGKIPPKEPEEPLKFLHSRLAYFNEIMSRPYVMGRDLVEAGIQPSKKFSEYLTLAHKMRIAGVSKENALRQVLAAARKDGQLPEEITEASDEEVMAVAERILEEHRAAFEELAK